MQQSLHILRKDLLHLWPETLVGIVLLIAFAWSAPYKATPSPFTFYIALLDAFLHILIPVAWLVIISRLIHDEPLVGDRQFWTSRPYHWAKLLLAKILYLLAFIYLPFLLMQVYLLKHAGLYPSTVLPALFHNLLLVTVIVIVPIAAIAAVTSTFARLLLSVLGALIYVIILVAFAFYFSFDRMLPPHINGLATAVLILLPAIALIFQYATRRTAAARAMLIGAPILAVLLFFLTPAASLIRHGYPAVGSGPTLSPFPIPNNPEASQGRLRILPHGDVQIALPFKVDGVDRDSAYLIHGISLTLDAPGVHWSSPYRTSLFGPGQINANPVTVLAVSLPLEIFNRVQNTPVDLHVSIATEHLTARSASTWKSSAAPFDIPGHGRCSFSDDPEMPPTCRFPFETPKFLYLTVPLSQDCANPNAPRIGANQPLGGQPATLNFDPVLSVPLNPTTGSMRSRGQICPGKPHELHPGCRPGQRPLRSGRQADPSGPACLQNRPATPCPARSSTRRASITAPGPTPSQRRRKARYALLPAERASTRSSFNTSICRSASAPNFPAIQSRIGSSRAPTSFMPSFVTEAITILRSASPRVRAIQPAFSIRSRIRGTSRNLRHQAVTDLILAKSRRLSPAVESAARCTASAKARKASASAPVRAPASPSSAKDSATAPLSRSQTALPA